MPTIIIDKAEFNIVGIAKDGHVVDKTAFLDSTQGHVWTNIDAIVYRENFIKLLKEEMTVFSMVCCITFLDGSVAMK